MASHIDLPLHIPPRSKPKLSVLKGLVLKHDHFCITFLYRIWRVANQSNFIHFTQNIYVTIICTILGPLFSRGNGTEGVVPRTVPSLRSLPEAPPDAPPVGPAPGGTVHARPPGGLPEGDLRRGRRPLTLGWLAHRML